MVRLSPYLVPFLLLSLVILAAPSKAEALRVYNTPPSALSGASPDDLNAFGLKLITEAYGIRSQVDRPTGDTVDAPAKIDSDAVRAVTALYDADAMVQRTRLNFALTAATYVPNYTGDFTISNVAATQASETVLVVSFDVRLPNRTSLQSGNVYSGDSMPRILVMRWNEAERMWKIFSHADFDAPRTFLCGANKDFMPTKSTFRPEDVSLAKDLWDEVQTASLTGQPETLQAKGFQYVFASGERKTAPGKIRARLKKREEITNVEAIRSRDLFVLRFDSVSPMEIDGGGIETAMRPRLVTFHLDADGKWRMIAIGVFQVTARLAANVACVNEGAE